MRKTVKQIMDNQKHFPQTWVCPKGESVEGGSVGEIVDNILDVLDLAKNEATRSRVRPSIRTITTHNQTTHDRLKAGIEGMKKQVEKDDWDTKQYNMVMRAKNQTIDQVLALVDEVYKDKN